VRTSTGPYCTDVRLVVADPPAFTPQYDHALAAALAHAGNEVTLLTSRFRFGDTPAPDGYALDASLYPLSSRIRGRSRLRLPLRAFEHVLAQRALGRVRGDVLHVQWLAWPRADTRLQLRVPSVFTAHDLLPRRTAARTKLWRTLLSRFDRVVVHSEQGRARLAELGVDARVIPHPVFPADIERSDDGRTVLVLGVLRPYKGLPDAIETTRRIQARLLVAGDPAGVDVADAPHVERRLGYLTEAEVDQALAQSTVAVFPYRPELDQSGALLRALGAGVPAVAYDVGGIAEPVRSFGAGIVVEPGNVEGLAEALRQVLDDPEPFRAGALRARRELTWEASARAHIALYEEIA
jgi:glycosyltransferase involved in cell wall biosynthesis